MRVAFLTLTQGFHTEWKLLQIMYIDIDIFVKCNWVVTWWQWYSTHLHTNNT